MKDCYKNVDDYITGRLTGSDLAAFEAELRSSTTLQKRVSACRELSDSLREDDTEKLRLGLKKAYSGYKARRKYITYRWVAASAASIIFLLLIFSNLFTPRNSSDVFSKYYSRFELVGIEREAISNDQLQVAELYQAGKFGELIACLSDSTKYDLSNSNLRLVLATAYLECNQPDSAIQILWKLSQNQKDINYETAKWYLMLSLLLKSNIADSYKHCLDLISYQGKYHNQSQKIKKDLELLLKQ